MKSFLTLLLLLCDDTEQCLGPPSITDFSKQRGIKFVHQDICGLLNDIPQLETFVSDTLAKIDIISLCETHINGPTNLNSQAIHLLRTTEKMSLVVGLTSF